MSFFSKLTDQEGVANEKDSLGGRTLLDTNIYLMNIVAAYAIKSDGGALGVSLQLKSDDGAEHKETIYVSNKKGENFYTNAKGEKNYLPGYNSMNSLALLVTGKPLSELDGEIEEKIIKVYDFDAKAEVPTKVPMIMPLVGEKIYAAIVKQTVSKKQKNEQTGEYEVVEGTREENQIDKFFCAKDGFEKLTSAEIRAKATEPKFFDDWKAKNEGKVFDKTDKSGATPAKPAPKGGGASTPKPTNSLFGN